MDVDIAPPPATIRHVNWSNSMSRDNSQSPFAMMEDADLVRKAQQGDILAFEQLVFRHDKKVLSIAARYVTSADDAKDIYQEVFLRVYRGLKKFRFKSEFSTWVHRITVNVCLTHRSRRRRTMQTILLDDRDEDGEAHGEIRDPAVGPDNLAVDADIASRIERALGVLSPKQRMVFTLRHFEGYRLGEIAQMMDCMEGTVKRYLFTATRRMRDQLKDAV
jgi:RNA polymerase sigma-70 factor, ECF subfamily